MIASCAAREQDLLVRVPLTEQWEMGRCADSRGPDQLNDLAFAPAHVPGTVAAALREQNAWQPGGRSLDRDEYWFRCRFPADPAEAGEEISLELDGIATLSEVWLNGRHILQSDSMFAAHRVDVSAMIEAHNELLIVCRPLATALRARRGQAPAQRWRTRVAGEQQLRWFRTTLLGRAPGFAPEPAPVGPWRPVTLLRRRRVAIENWSRRVELDGATGVVRAEFDVRLLEAGALPVSGVMHCGEFRAPIEWEQTRGRVALRIPNVERWFPHTHGEARTYPLSIEWQLADGATISFADGPVGFRSLEFGDAGLRVNGVAIFCRGVVWTPIDPFALTVSEERLRERLQLLRDGGFNLLRLAGTMIYEAETFHRLCDEMGLLVWQDLMYANMDYPFADSAFRDTACREAERELSRLSRHASTAVLCGNSEIEQQAAMLGLDPAMARGPFFGEELPHIAARCCPGVPYIPSAPSGGDLPFRNNAGVANYFGVGAYLRPLEDVRRAEVRFASECLAFANVPEPEMIAKMGNVSPIHPEWKRGVSRDAGVGWDFEDVRDFYLKLLYSADPMMLRYADLPRYWELSRVVTGEVMAEVFGEWRRAGSPCGGGAILWSADLYPGAGWGILDSDGRPKAAYWFLKRALATRAVWTTDEGLNGVDVHVANDGPAALDGGLRVALYQHGEHQVAESERAISIPPHTTERFGVEQLLGRFVDASYAYRFGPPGHDLIAASLRVGDDVVAQSFRFPAGRSTNRVPIHDLGITAECRPRDGSIQVRLSTRRFASGVRVAAANALPGDSYFGIEPGGVRTVSLTPAPSGKLPSSVTVTAINAEGRLSIPLEAAP